MPDDRRADRHRHAARPVRPRHPAARATGLVGRLNRLAHAVRTTGGAVIFIQHDGPPGDPHHPGAPGWRLLPALDVRPVDTVIRKESCDAFLHTSLEAFLRGAGHRPADHHRLGDRLLRRHHHPQRAGARLSDDRALGWSHHGGPAPSRRRPRSSSITTPSGPTSWRPAGPPWCVPARTCGYPPKRRLASTAPACLTSRFSDKENARACRGCPTFSASRVLRLKPFRACSTFPKATSTRTDRIDKRRDLLSGRTVINLFFENSTRTRTSFEVAAKRLGADVINMDVATSSVRKGETLLDTAMTLNAMRPDAIVVRHRNRARSISCRRRSTAPSSTPATASTSIRPRRCSTRSPSDDDAAA